MSLRKTSLPPPSSSSSSSSSLSWMPYTIAPTNDHDDEGEQRYDVNNIPTENSIHAETITSSVPNDDNEQMGGIASLSSSLSSLPEEVQRIIATIHHPIVAWTHLDPSISNIQLNRYTCCTAFGPLLFLPCFWPHLTIIWPCLLSIQVSATNQAKNTYWILTTHELIMIITDHDGFCCIPGLFRTGIKVQAIPLENIIDIRSDRSGQGIINRCCCGNDDIPTLQFDTAATICHGGDHHQRHGTKHGLVGIGLENYDWFMQQVLRTRDAVVHQRCGGGGVGSVVVSSSSGHLPYANNGSTVGAPAACVELTPYHHIPSTMTMMNRHDDVTHLPIAHGIWEPTPTTATTTTSSTTTTNTAEVMGVTIEQRFEELQRLHDKGYITNEEYQKKRQEILSSL